MPIEDLRKWKVWDMTPTILGYAKPRSHNTIPDRQAGDPEVRHRRGVRPTRKTPRPSEFVKAARKQGSQERRVPGRSAQGGVEAGPAGEARADPVREEVAFPGGGGIGYHTAAGWGTDPSAAGFVSELDASAKHR